VKASILRFYEEDPRRFEVLRKFASPTVNAKPPLALRKVDYFVVRYSEEERVHYLVNDGLGHFRMVHPHSEYKAQLKSFSKEWFDPFNRGKKFEIRGIKTTWRQMNFFKWAMSDETMVLTYMINHRGAITRTYNRRAEEAKLASSSDPEKKKKGSPPTHATSAPPAGCVYHLEEKMLIHFPTAKVRLVQRTYVPGSARQSDVIRNRAREQQRKPKRQQRLVLSRPEVLEVSLGAEHDRRSSDHEGHCHAKYGEDTNLERGVGPQKRRRGDCFCERSVHPRVLEPRTKRIISAE